jgi:hypothetical protein
MVRLGLCCASTPASSPACASSSSCSPAGSGPKFEWFSHEAEARKAGLSEQTIATLRHGGSTFAAGRAVDPRLRHELLRNHHAGDATSSASSMPTGRPASSN